MTSLLEPSLQGLLRRGNVQLWQQNTATGRLTEDMTLPGPPAEGQEGGVRA
jgi:hypothetical protein